MQHLKVAAIVEGDGEVPSAPILLRRIAEEFIPGLIVHALKPIRQPRQKLLANKDDCLAKSLALATAKLRQVCIPDAHDLILLLIDADDDCAATIGPSTLDLARDLRRDMDIACVFAVLEYETWFVAAAESLDMYLKFDEVSKDPEAARCRKAWIKKHFAEAKYSESVDQPRLTARMNLALCRERAPSFDKLCRELEARFRHMDQQG